MLIVGKTDGVGEVERVGTGVGVWIVGVGREEVGVVAVGGGVVGTV